MWIHVLLTQCTDTCIVHAVNNLYSEREFYTDGKFLYRHTQYIWPTLKWGHHKPVSETDTDCGQWSKQGGAHQSVAPPPLIFLERRSATCMYVEVSSMREGERSMGISMQEIMNKKSREDDDNKKGHQNISVACRTVWARPPLESYFDHWLRRPILQYGYWNRASQYCVNKVLSLNYYHSSIYPLQRQYCFNDH